MHERQKLAEAHYFLQCMRSEHDDRTNFRFELSAFLGAARSVLQYALEEVKSKSGGQKWYDQAVSSEPLLAFFKDKRDANIHSMPVNPATRMTMHESEFFAVDEETVIPFRHNTSTYSHRFADWPADETVVELSTQYLNALHAFVAAGIANQMITG